MNYYVFIYFPSGGLWHLTLIFVSVLVWNKKRDLAKKNIM